VQQANMGDQYSKRGSQHGAGCDHDHEQDHDCEHGHNHGVDSWLVHEFTRNLPDTSGSKGSHAGQYASVWLRKSRGEENLANVKPPETQKSKTQTIVNAGDKMIIQMMEWLDNEEMPALADDANADEVVEVIDRENNDVSIKEFLEDLLIQQELEEDCSKEGDLTD